MASTDDPFAAIGGLDPGSVPAEEYRTMAQKPIANAALPLTSDRPRLSAYAQEGQFTSLADVESKELLIHSIEPITTKYGSAYKVGVTDLGGAVHVLCLGQTMIVPAIDALLEEGEPDYPIAVRFERKALDGGKSCWILE